MENRLDVPDALFSLLAEIDECKQFEEFALCCVCPRQLYHMRGFSVMNLIKNCEKGNNGRGRLNTLMVVNVEGLPQDQDSRSILEVISSESQD